MSITVIVCTYNRSKSLARTLDSIAVQALPEPIDWDVLVVDNNSTDQTHEVVQDFQAKYPGRFQYLIEKHQGVSYARNAGIQNASGEILVFIDDDEYAESGWLQNLTAHLHTGEWAGAGGPVISQWDRSKPRWLQATNSFTLGPLAAFNYDAGPDGGAMTDPPVGANMAFRKEAFEAYGGFRVDLGRIGALLLANEDIEFGRRLLQAGLSLRWEPKAVVYHPVEEYRVSKKYFQSWWFNKGRSEIVERTAGVRGHNLFAVLFWQLRHASVEAIRWTLTFDPSVKFVCKLKLWTYAGEAYQSCLQFLDMKGNSSSHDAQAR